MTAPDRLTAFGDPDLLTGRLFFALAVPNPVKAPLEALSRDLTGTLPGARLTAPAGWHLTLAFLGQVRAEFASDVVTVGEAAATAAPRRLTLRLEGAGGFPGEAKANVLWTGVGGDLEPLTALADRLTSGFREVGMTSADRAFHAHLTLARLPQPRRLPPELLDRIAAAAATAPPWNAIHLHCYRSTQTNQGAKYTVLRSFRLGGEAAAAGGLGAVPD